MQNHSISPSMSIEHKKYLEFYEIKIGIYISFVKTGATIYWCELQHTTHAIVHKCSKTWRPLDILNVEVHAWSSASLGYGNSSLYMELRTDNLI